MGKNFEKNAGGKNATSRLTKRNISKKESDKKRRQVDYDKQVAKNAKVEQKKQEWEMRRQAKKKIAEFKRPAGFDAKKSGDDWEDVDEHEKDVFDKDGYFDVMETEKLISTGDQTILDKFKSESNKPARVSEGKSLADLIMAKLSSGDF